MPDPMCIERFAGELLPLTAPPNTHRPRAWCALAEGANLDPSATSDRTLCGYVVMLRLGSGRRKPTCPDCIEALKLGHASP